MWLGKICACVAMDKKPKVAIVPSSTQFYTYKGSQGLFVPKPNSGYLHLIYYFTSTCMEDSYRFIISFMQVVI